ncbi:peptidoglycan-associated lipoprotein Pal [Roseateles sp. P5_E1]
MNKFRIRAALAAIATSVTACTSTVVEPLGTIVVAPLPPAASAPLPKPKAEPAAQVIKVLPPHLDPDSELYRHRSVFFTFDQSTLRAQARSVVEAHGIYLWRYPELHVRVEGNTDDRGGREYNLALGQRRAEAVRAAMRLLGARDEQIETVSYGEEKPRRQGTNEASRAHNRRADIVYRRTSR